jgi:Core-2/I-Branching enzyme
VHARCCFSSSFELQLMVLNPKPFANRWRMCFLDEHYIPSLLAFHGLDNETDCHGGLATANWTMPKAQHPIEYASEQISPKL